jgi:acyl carrier protein
MNIENFIADFEELFDEIEQGSIEPTTIFRDIDEWSSLIALTLIAMIDENYNQKITGDDIRNSVTVEDLFNKLAK